ncbi:transcription antiterminator BglG [Paenibacillus chitinolyticus]|uniref:BglG family transcription antiterminator n=1 Tax=Paenibacillus chitinolyticus TaxID=79263 RepID=UPI0026E4AB87|nr:PRD domain-containing protein [Paenibacillus chitinolyticus]GKS12014.1 transcription antiterminator BglG [Paenibacillus chitinolyticus]
MTLTTRSRALLKKIVYSHSPLRIKECAEEFQVSERTVKYDLESIRLWLQQEQIELLSKPSRGIWIDCSDTDRIHLLEKLDAVGEHVFLNQQGRMRHMLIDLLLLDGYLTIGELVAKHDVSRNTVQADLALADQLLAGSGLTLDRTRHGIRVSGSEMKRRGVLEHVIQDLLDGNDMFQIVQGVVQERRPHLHFSKLLEWFLQPVRDLDRVFEDVGSLVREIREKTQLLLTDNAIIGVFIRLCIVIQRQRPAEEQPAADSGERPVACDQRSLAGYHLSISDLFRQKLTGLFAELELPLSEENIRYVSLPAIGLIPPLLEARDEEGAQLPDAFAVTKKLIDIVSESVHVRFRKDPDLMQHLHAHIADKLNKYSYGVAEPNPLLQEILRSYRTMFETVRSACGEVFSPYGILLSDSDIAYIVLHFQAAFERRQEVQQYRALVVCGTGRGTSKLLKTVIENEIKTLQVAAFCSVMEFDKQVVGDFDLVISIFPIEAHVPVVVVNPIPDKNDFKSIRLRLENLEKHGGAEGASAGRSSSLQRPELSYLEQKFQDIIWKGFELSRAIRTRFAPYLNEERLEGLTLHLLFMMNRIAFDTAYIQTGSAPSAEGAEGELAEELKMLLSEHRIHATEGEVMAILRYFERSA